jgi:peptidoglycan/LPS O-acetylase OafA/YrhL
MSRQHELTLITIFDFYFRRFKRIIPTYVLVIVIVLIFFILFGPKYDFPHVVNEIMPSALFYYNWPKVHLLSYFDVNSKYSLFLHTWSLSCEFEFYLMFPLFFAFVMLLGSLHFLLSFVFAFAVIFYSFIIQTTTTESDGRHMIFMGRLWQFFLGYISHCAHESDLIKSVTNSEIKSGCNLILQIENII